MSGFKIVTIPIAGCEGTFEQIYITKSEVSVGQIQEGDDTGVLCLCLSEEAADLIMRALEHSPPADA